VDRLMKELAFKTPRNRSKQYVDPLRSIKTTLREHYQKKRAYLHDSLARTFRRNLFRIFPVNHASVTAERRSIPAPESA
jgi:hypothetical protein